jgi:hypothetical protein
VSSSARPIDIAISPKNKETLARLPVLNLNKKYSPKNWTFSSVMLAWSVKDPTRIMS